jgi:hypothetical protein
MPPISGRPLNNGNATMKGGRTSVKNSKLLVKDIKSSSTPKMQTTSNFLNQDSLLVDE